MSVQENPVRSESPVQKEYSPGSFSTSTVLTDKERSLFSLFEDLKKSHEQFSSPSPLDSACAENPTHPIVIQLTKLNGQEYTNPEGIRKTGLELFNEARQQNLVTRQIKKFNFTLQNYNTIDNLSKQIVAIFKQHLFAKLRTSVQEIRTAWAEYFPKGPDRSPLKELCDQMNELNRISPSTRPCETAVTENGDESKIDNEIDDGPI